MITQYKEYKDIPNKVIYEGLIELSDADIVLRIAAQRLKAFDDFYDSVSCLFAEGVEFMNKIELYNEFKKEFLKL